MMSKKSLITMFAIALGGYFISTGHAGSSRSHGSTVYMGGFIRGVPAKVRSSASGIEYIGCGVRMVGYASAPVVFCNARDANGTHRSCWTTFPGYADVVAAMNHNSLLTFQITGSTCSSIEIINDSRDLPGSGGSVVMY